MFGPKSKPTFEVRWLKGQFSVENEMTTLPRLEQVVANARGKFADVRRRHPGNEPDAFRVLDAAGKELASHSFLEAVRV